jgi:uncharacterized protein YdhG (YjbR/CyaY superfamily)
MEKVSKPVSVDEYIISSPAGVKPILVKLREIIKKSAPGAEEKISYGMPFYSYYGRLVYFMAHKNHIGFYPMKSAITKFREELEPYNTSAGTVQFPYDKPLPYDLIEKITLFRVEENRLKSGIKKNSK